MLEGIESYDDHRIHDDRLVLGDVERDVEVIAFSAERGVDLGFRKAVHTVERLHAEHVAAKLHRVEYRRLGESDPAREGKTIEERRLLRVDRRAQQLLFERLVALEFEAANDLDAFDFLGRQWTCE